MQYGPFILVFQKLNDSILSLIIDEGENEGIASSALDTIHSSMRRILKFACFFSLKEVLIYLYIH